MGKRRKKRSQPSTSPVDDGRRVWKLPNSKEVHVLEPKHPVSGGPPPSDAIQLKSALGMPEDAIWARLALEGAFFGDKWRSYELELFGMYVPANQNAVYPWPFWSITDKQGRVAPLVIQIWRQTIKHQDSPVFGEILWSPTLSIRISIRGLEHSSSSEDVELARRGLKLLETVTHSGRPFGSTALSTEEFLLRAPIACRKWIERFDGKCTDVNLAEALDISTSTLYKYLKRTGLKMKDIREQAKRLDFPR